MPLQMLLGAHEHTIDDKNRLTFPARFRGSFGEGVVVTAGLDGCLDAYTRAHWQQLVDKRLANVDPLSADGRAILRHFFANAQEGELDRQGRLMLPAGLMERAKLGREVVVAGVYDHLEIWDRAAWRAQEAEGSAEHVAERLAAQRN
jgi:MraZ protein